MSDKKNPLSAAADKVVEKVQEAVRSGNEIPGAPTPVPPTVDEPTEPAGPLPPKPDQSGPDTYSPTGQETGIPQKQVAQGGDRLTTAQGRGCTTRTIP